MREDVSLQCRVKTMYSRRLEPVSLSKSFDFISDVYIIISKVEHQFVARKGTVCQILVFRLSYTGLITDTACE
jgi:hypothetical protein